MKKLYYVVEKELQSYSDCEETTGMKTVSVYTIENDEPVKFFDLDIENDVETKSAIQEFLDDNGYGDSTYTMKQL